MITETNLILRRAVRMALLSGGALAAGVAGQSSIAQAEEAGANEPTLSEVVVTGSRISSPNLDAISPVTAITSEEVRATGVTRVEDLLNSLPQVVADQGSGLSMGSTGTATLNLRGLGPQRTLVLINGRRLQGGDPVAPSNTNLGYASTADVNQIPVALIERVDVLTGGASSTYGADAVAGVVNFIMNDHFEGVRVDANAGIYNHENHEDWINTLLKKRSFPTVNGSNWDGRNLDFTIVMGHNFADGAGNFEGYLGWRSEAPATADHRDHAACVLDPSSPYACGGSSTSAPAIIFGSDGSANQFSPTGDVVGRYARFNYAASHYLQRIDERYTAGFFGKLKFNDHVETYTEFMFMDDSTRGNYAPAGAFLASGKSLDGDTGLPDGNWTVNCGTGAFGNAGMNPYLTAAEFTNFCGAPYTNKTNSASATPRPAYQIGNGVYAPFGDAQLLLGRRNVEGGPREDEYTHTTFRGVFGARGEIVPDWNYDIYGLYGRTRSIDYHTNDTSSARMQNAMLAVTDPTTGNIVCRGGATGCVPWNIWNPAIAVSQAALNYIGVPGTFLGAQDENVVSGYISGDLTHAGIKSPLADDGLKAVFGAEYRRQALTTRPDAEFLSGDLAGLNTPIPAVSASMHVWEGFTEFRLPLVRNVPFVKTLDFETGYRYSSYTTGFDTHTYKFGVEWAPVSDIRLRGSWNRAVRAPNLQELFRPNFVGLDGGGDGCAPDSGPKFTAAQCALTGLAPGAYPATSSPAGQYNGLIGGNTNVKPEVGKTINVGLVFTPTFLPGFSATVDYTDIKITNIITTYGPNVIQANCVLSGSITSSWCQMIHRNAIGSLWSSPQAYTIDPLLNLGALENESIDLGLAYRLNLGGLGRLRTRLDGSYLVKLITSPGSSPSYDCAGYFGPSCAPATPKWRHRLTLDWDTPFSGLSAGATWRYFATANNSLLDPKNTADFLGAGAPKLADAYLPSMSYLDLRVSYAVNKITIRAGVNNVMDKDPPTLDTIASGGNSIYAESNTYPSLYDTLGRFLFVNVTVDF
jgi:iron complex outermembrane receptor protein